ncbi:MAG: D-aminoacyl-tRNA deacylase [Pseudomonadota bacterium]
MKALLQRVTTASVHVCEDEAATSDDVPAPIEVGRIDKGLLVFLALEPDDSIELGEALIERVLDYRVFSDSSHRMNLSLRDVSGGLLLVSQFTLAATTSKGLRPGFSSAMPPADASILFAKLYEYAQQVHHDVRGGRFGADMQVSLTNDGPVTFLLEAK